MASPAAVERRARALAMLGMAMRASAVENQRRERRRLLMVGAMVAKLAKLRRSRIPTTRFHHPQTSEAVVFHISAPRRCADLVTKPLPPMSNAFIRSAWKDAKTSL